MHALFVAWLERQESVRVNDCRQCCCKPKASRVDLREYPFSNYAKRGDGEGLGYLVGLFYVKEEGSKFADFA